MKPLAHLFSAIQLLWLASGIGLAQAAPGEDPVTLTQPVDYLRLPTAKAATSVGLETINSMPARIKAKVARYQAKAMAGAEDIYTDKDVVTTVTSSPTGIKKTCVQDIASNTTTGNTAFNRFGPNTAKDQIVVLQGDLVNVCQ